MKKLTILIISIIFYTCSSSSDPNDKSQRIYLSPASSDVSVSGQVDLNLMIENFQQTIFGLSLQVDYNNSLLSFSDSSGISFGGLFGQSTVKFVSSNGNTIYISVSQIRGQSSVSGSGTICTISFQASAPGASNVEISPSDLHFYDFAGNDISISELEISSAAININ